ncbi:MAG: hypothetical protein LQ351_008169 [Letrouitia transgressa]|nr:MAG: hypothetical protein LQ351_008169 [Letrouitia transgressa]
MTELGVTFATSSTAKRATPTVRSEDRKVRASRDFRIIENESHFFSEIKSYLYAQKDQYILLNMDKTPRGVANSLVVIDIDSRRNGLLATKINEQLAEPSPFVNLTPHGVHLFFYNQLKIKQRRLNKILNLGCIADMFSRGWVTILGKGYSLRCLYGNPLEVRTLPHLPSLFQESKSVVPCLRMGEYENSLNSSYFREHFSLNEMYEPTNIRAEEILLDFIQYLPRVLPTVGDYPESLQNILLKHGAPLSEDRSNALLEPPRNPLELEEEDESSGDSSDTDSDMPEAISYIPFRFSNSGARNEESPLFDEGSSSESDDENSSSYSSSDEEDLDEQEVSGLHQPKEVTLKYIEKYG